MRNKYKVLSNEFHLTYDTHTKKYSGPVQSPGVGAAVWWESDSPNGNVWFIDEDHNRGKCEAGEVNNLVRRGLLEVYND